MPTFFLTAAEHSGDALGAALIGALRRRYPEAQFVGVGGPRMAAAGCRLLANPMGRSKMLVGALVTEARYWYRLVKEIRSEIRAIKPNVVIPIDSSAINLRIAGVAREQGVAVCYYVAPQVWASRPWRVKKIRTRVDTLCCILPFEEAYFRERGVNAVYVGHPMFDVAADGPDTDPAHLDPPLPNPPAPTEPSTTPPNGRPPRASRRLPDWWGNATFSDERGPKIAIFPGSRKQEIDAHMPPMLEVMSEIKGRFGRVNFVAVAPSEERAWQIRHHLRDANTPVDIRVGRTASPDSAQGTSGTNSPVSDAVIRWADLVLTKSGTTTLQVARHHKPMVVLYRVAWWKWHLFAKFLITTRFITLVNILAGRELVPEFIPFYGSPLPIARQCIDLLANPDRRLRMAQDLQDLIAPLLPRGGILAADRVAAEVAKLCEPAAVAKPATT
jgi:lipid-A-disaccharide synthase